MADKNLTPAQLSVFCSSMAMMLRSGVSAQESSALFAEDNRGPLAEISAKMSSRMEQGAGFAQAAQAAGGFPAYALGVFQTAEFSGRLDEALERLAEDYRRQDELDRRLRETVAYPVAQLLLMCGVLAVLVFGVLPMFHQVYTSLTGSLAGSAYAYVSAAAVIGRVSLILAAVVSAALLALLLAMGTEKGKKALQKPLEESFLTRNAAWKLAASRMADTLSTLLASGTSPDSAISLAMEMTEHGRMKAVLSQCAQEMTDGESMEDCLFRHGVFPPLYGRMLIGGARSGNLDESLRTLAAQLSQEAEAELCGIMDAAEPALVGFLTVAVGATLLSVMLPLLGILAAV